ncbi:hypothetical protein D3C87_2106910 [compost metagenome]
MVRCQFYNSFLHIVHIEGVCAFTGSRQINHVALDPLPFRVLCDNRRIQISCLAVRILYAEIAQEHDLGIQRRQ